MTFTSIPNARNTHSSVLSFSGLRCTPRLMERSASTRNLSMLKRLSSTIPGSSTTSRWERAVWVSEGAQLLRFDTAVWMLRVFTFVCVLLYLFDFVYEWKEGPVVIKVGSGATPALHWMNIWLKRCLSTLSQRLLCFKASRHNVRGGGGGAKRSMRLPDCRPLFSPSFYLFLSFFFAPLHTPIFPSLLSVSLCSLCAVSLSECYYSAGKHLSCPLGLLPVPLSLTLLPSSLWRKVFCWISPSLLPPWIFFSCTVQVLLCTVLFVSIIKVRYSESARSSRPCFYWERRKQKTRAVERKKKAKKVRDDVKLYLLWRTCPWWSITLHIHGANAVVPALSLLLSPPPPPPCLLPTPSTFFHLSLTLISNTSVC